MAKSLSPPLTTAERLVLLEPDRESIPIGHPHCTPWKQLSTFQNRYLWYEAGGDFCPCPHPPLVHEIKIRRGRRAGTALSNCRLMFCLTVGYIYAYF